MILGVNVNSITQIDINEVQAFEILLKTLNMEFVLDEDTKFFIKKDNDFYGENGVYIIENGKAEKYDDRGDLFIALRNVAVNMFPNLLFRSAEYIYNN